MCVNENILYEMNIKYKQHKIHNNKTCVNRILFENNKFKLLM